MILACFDLIRDEKIVKVEVIEITEKTTYKTYISDLKQACRSIRNQLYPNDYLRFCIASVTNRDLRKKTNRNTNRFLRFVFPELELVEQIDEIFIAKYKSNSEMLMETVN